MFYGCSSLESLDLSSWDTSNVTDMGWTFEDCKKLKTIYVSDKFVTTNVTDSTSMFAHVSSIV